MTRLAIKVTDAKGKTRFGGLRLAVGTVVRRKRSGKLWPCSYFAVHVYDTLAQARLQDRFHCNHGPRGLVWLVRVRDPEVPLLSHDKLVAKSYRVIRRLGPLGLRQTTERYSKALKKEHKQG